MRKYLWGLEMALDEIEVVLDMSIYNYIVVKNDSITFGMSVLKRLKGNSICPEYVAHFYPELEVQFEGVTLKKDKRVNVILHEQPDSLMIQSRFLTKVF